MTIEKVTIAGASGTLGTAILNGILSAKAFTVTVLSRSSSKSTYPESVHVKTIPDDMPTEEELVDILRGQDALIDVFGGSKGDLHILFANAADRAGVKRFMPADFGSCDSSSPRVLELLPLYREKQRVREHLQHLASTSTLTWTSLVCGHFFDYGLECGLLLFDLKNRAVQILDNGDTRFSTTTLATIATAVVRILQKEDETKNRMLYIQSFCVTQNEILRSLKTATGTSESDWHVSSVRSAGFIEREKSKLDRNPQDSEASEALVSALGIVDAFWEGQDGFANELLGLGREDMDAVVRSLVGPAEKSED